MSGCTCEPEPGDNAGYHGHEKPCPEHDGEPDFLDEAMGAALGFAFLVDEEPEEH